MEAERQSQAIPTDQGIPKSRGISGAGQHRARLRFQRLPAAYCHPERIAQLLPEGLPTSFRDRLLASKRLRRRLSEQLAERFALEPCEAEDLATPEGRFAALENEELQSALRRVGAIWHARTIRKIILAERLRELVAWLGRDNHRAALRFIDLAPDEPPGNDVPDANDDAQDLQILMGRIERDGLMAVNAWCRHQPAALAGRLRLKLPPGPETDDEPPASHADRGLLIVDRVVMGLLANSESKAGTDG